MQLFKFVVQMETMHYAFSGVECRGGAQVHFSGNKTHPSQQQFIFFSFTKCKNSVTVMRRDKKGIMAF